MPIDIFVNELSFNSPASTKNDAQYRVTQFLKTLAEAREAKIKGALRVEANFHTQILAPDYTLMGWSFDRTVDKDERVYYHQLTLNCPFLNDSQEAQDKASLIEGKIEGQNAVGCAYAYWFNGLCVSLPSATQWDTPSLSTKIKSFNEAAELEEREEAVTHASQPKHIDAHKDWIGQQLASGIRDWKDFWNQRATLFPHLEFCPEVENQLPQLERNRIDLIRESLTKLEDYAKNWTSGGFDPKSVSANVSPESETTLQKYATERTFTLSNGKQRVFDWHLKINTPSWRIHFLPEPPGKIIIGYIGKHLPTATNPT